MNSQPNPIIENILTRRSVRSFRPEQITEEELSTILMAGSYAPNGMGLQTWRFTAIQNPEMLQRIQEGLRQTLLSIPVQADTPPHILRYIERAKDTHTQFLFNAPTYVLVSNEKDNRNAMADCALAIGTMMLAAHALGIGSCWLNQLPQVSILEVPGIRQVLDEVSIPENHLVYGSFVLGYPAEEPKAAKTRKDVIRIFR